MHDSCIRAHHSDLAQKLLLIRFVVTVHKLMINIFYMKTLELVHVPPVDKHGKRMRKRWMIQKLPMQPSNWHAL